MAKSKTTTRDTPTSDDALRVRARALSARVASLAEAVGAFPHSSRIIKRQLDEIERALDVNESERIEADGQLGRAMLGSKHDVVHREVVAEMIRSYGATLRKYKQAHKRVTSGEIEREAQEMAHEMIHWDAPEPVFPWLPKLAGAETELVKAIRRPSDESIGEVLRKLGLYASPSARRMSRMRDRHIPR